MLQEQVNMVPETSDVDLNIEDFQGDVIRALTGELERTVGLQAAEGYINAVGCAIGDRISDAYIEKLGALPDDAEGLAALLVDLKRRIGGEFRAVSVAPNRIEFLNTRCPFGTKVEGRPSLCMMTTNVFGSIAAQATGYAHVEVARTIARGDGCCQVCVTLDEKDGNAETGHEFFG